MVRAEGGTLRPWRKAGARTEDTEEGKAGGFQLQGHDKDNGRAEHGRLDSRVEDETEDREGRKELITKLINKQRAG